MFLSWLQDFILQIFFYMQLLLQLLCRPIAQNVKVLFEKIML